VTQRISDIEASRQRLRIFLANRAIALRWAVKGFCKPCAHWLFTIARWLVPEVQRFLLHRTQSQSTDIRVCGRFGRPSQPHTATWSRGGSLDVKGKPSHSKKNGSAKKSTAETCALSAIPYCKLVGVGVSRRAPRHRMSERPDLFKEELDQLSDQEIEARLAAAVWVDDKRAAVLRYLEDKKLGRKKAAQSGELEIARRAKEAAWVAVDVAKDAQRRAKLARGVAAAAAIAAAALAAVIAYLKP
jgi:hypothetical protein